MVGGGEDDGGYTTAADCISAGMYWFGQSDLVAAEAWWRRALELEPANQRAQECLRLLGQTSSTGFKSDSWARLPAASESSAMGVKDAQPSDLVDPFRARSSPSARAEGPPEASRGTDSLDLPNSAFESGDLEKSDGPPYADGASWRPHAEEASGEEDWKAADAWGRPDGQGSESVPPGSGDLGSPWDAGPSRTSVVNVQSSGEFDAVASPTPLPEVDRERFFNRGDPTSREEIVEFLRATGDLPETGEQADSGWGQAPEAAPAGPSGPADFEELTLISDAIATEPAMQVDPESPRSALQAARARYQLHDFQGVLEALERYPAEAEAQTEVRTMTAESRAHLLRMYEAKIGSLDQIPRVLVSSEEIIWLNLNHRAGFILSQVDGTVTYEDLISLSGMPRLDTVRILTELLDQTVIGV